MAFEIGSDQIEETAKAQQLPSISVGTNGCSLYASPKNQAEIFIASSEGGTYRDDRVAGGPLGRITLKPGGRTAIVRPSNLNEMWVMGTKGDTIAWAIS